MEVKPPPPPPPAPEVIEIVANEQEIIETILESTETDQSEFVQVDLRLDDIKEVIEEEHLEKDIPFAIIEEPPVFPGCTGTKEEKKQCLQDQITKLVNKNFRTELSQELGLTEGKKKVYVQFKIDKTGSIVDIQARGPHVRLEKEAIRVVELLPDMIPGKQRGKPVGVAYTLPITLLVQGN
jgi:protein TonB